MAGVPAATPMARQEASASGYGIAARAFSGLAHTVATTGNELLRIQGALQAEDAKLDMQTRFNQLKLDFGLRESELRGSLAMPQPGGVTATTGPMLGQDEAAPAPTGQLQPKDYATVYAKEIDTLADASIKGLKYPGMERQYRAMIAGYVGTQKIEALNRGIKLQHEAMVLTDGLAAREEATAAVFGTPEERAQAFAARTSRIRSFVETGIYSGEKGAAMMQEFLGQVERGEVSRDLRDPDRRPVIMDRLVSGGYKHIPPAEQLSMARTEQDRYDTRARQAEVDARREFKEEQDVIVSDLYARAGDKSLTKAEFEQWRVRWRIGREDSAAILNELERVREEKEAPSDPATLNRVTLDVHSQQPQMTEAQIKDLRAQVLLNRKDALAAMDRLRETRKALESKGESEGMRRHAQAEQELRAALGIPTLFDKLDPAKEKAWQLALPELRRRSSMYGGKEDPLAVVESIRPRYQKMLGQDAALTEQQTGSLLRFPNPAALDAARKAGQISDGEYTSQREIFLHADRLKRDREMREAGELLQKQADKALGKAKPKAGATGSGGGKTLGR
jgi:hypothetical protein